MTALTKAIAVGTETGPTGAVATETVTVLDEAVIAMDVETGEIVMAMAAWIADTVIAEDTGTETDAGEMMMTMMAGTGDDIQEHLATRATQFHQLHG